MLVRPIVTLLTLCLLALPAFADMKSKNRMTVSGHSFESAVYIKGARQRQEMQLMPGFETVNIHQCDLHRIVILNPKKKTYMIQQLDEESDTASAPEAKPEPKSSTGEKSSATPQPKSPGGTITLTMNARDTGEKKDFFGYKARHVLTEMKSEATENAQCGANMNMKTDGWYIDFTDEKMQCANSPRAAIAARGDGGGGPKCNDKVRIKSTGTARLGYPVLTEMTMMGPQGQPMTMKQETLELSKAQLDQALFEIPPGYREVSTYQELMGGFTGMMGAAISGAKEAANAAANSAAGMGPVGEASAGNQIPAKEAGKLRVGVIRLGNSSGQTLPETEFRDRLIGELRGLNVDTLALALPNTATREQAEDVASKTDCDYFVYTDIAQAKGSGGGKKAGGFLARATGLDSSSSTAATYTLGLNYKMYAVGDPAIRYEATALATDGSNAEQSGANALGREAMRVAVQTRIDAELRRRQAKK